MQPAPAYREGADSARIAEQVVQYTDEGCHGVGTDRPQLQALLQQLSAVSDILVEDLTRLTRRTHEAIELVDVIERSNARIVRDDLPGRSAADDASEK